MISRDYRTIFVHIPKTGGQSVETVFLNVLGFKWEDRAALLLRRNENRERGPRRLAHMYAREYVDLGHATSEEFSGFFKFAVVRNPWARAVSNYKYIFPKRDIPFDFFLDQVIGQGLHLNDTRQIDPQVEYVRGENGALLVDRIIRFENMAAEFAEVSRRIFGSEQRLPVVNVSLDRRPYQTFYTPATRKIVEEKYRDDIEAFGYEFDNG